MSLFEITILQNQVMIMEALAVLMAKDELKTAKLLSMAKAPKRYWGCIPHDPNRCRPLRQIVPCPC